MLEIVTAMQAGETGASVGDPSPLQSRDGDGWADGGAGGRCRGDRSSESND
jgi:hypothetical protein